METAFLAFFFFFLLFAFTTKAEYVYDSDGEPLRNAGKYYFSPADPIGGPSIIAAAIRKGDSDACSLAVVQKLYTSGWATVIATPLNVAFISIDNPLNISFAYLPPNKCTDSPNWIVTRSLPVGQPVMVGRAEKFGAAFVEGWFYIQPYEYDNDTQYNYKLVFCHKPHQCGHIGAHIDSKENNRLVVTNKGEPLLFKFDKVKESFASDLSMVV